MRNFGKLWAFGVAVSGAFLLGSTEKAQSISLEEAVRTAVTTNPASKAADSDVQASAMELLQLEREYQPSLSVYGEVGGGYFDDADRLNIFDQRDTKIYREVGVVGELTLFDGYRRANLVYQNAAALDGAIFRLLDASETLALNAVEAYIDVLRHRSLLTVATRNIQRHIEIIDQVDELIGAGRLPASTGFEAEERLLAARLSKVEVQRALYDANSRFLSVIGKDPDGNMNVPFVNDLPLNKREFVISSVRNNFRLKQFDSNILAVEFNEGVQTADELPQVSLQAGARHGRDVSGTSGSESDVFVGVRVDWEFYAGGRAARERALQYRTSEARAERDAVRREVFELAERAWHSYDANIERTVLLSKRLVAARETARQYEEQFQTGSRSLIDLLDAEATIFNVQFEKVSAEASFTFGQYRLLASQGVLAKRFNVTAANVPLNPDFVARATTGTRPQAIFNTEIKALE